MDKMEIICIGCMLECMLIVDTDGNVAGNRCDNGVTIALRQWQKQREERGGGDDE